MHFFSLLVLINGAVLVLVALAVLVPRRHFAIGLRNQLAQEGGHIFTPTRLTWEAFLNRTRTPVQFLVPAGYGVLVMVLALSGAGETVVAASVALGLYLLLRHLLQILPPTYGLTSRGVTVLSWLPSFPLGLGSTFIPWHAVEICAIEIQFIIVLTGRQQVQLVFDSHLEDRICSYVDKLLRQQGFVVDGA